MQKLIRTCSEFTFLTLFIVFNLLHIMHQLCFLYMLNYPVMYSLSERERERARESESERESERVAVNMQGTVYLSQIENSSYHQDDSIFFMIARCDAVENYMLFGL